MSIIDAIDDTENPAPFLVSSKRITYGGKRDLKISPAEYYPLYWKHRVVDIADLFAFHLTNNRYFAGKKVLKKRQRPCISVEKLKWRMTNKFPSHQLRNLVRVTKIGPETTKTDDFPKQQTTATVLKVKKKFTVKDKDPGPGPGSYNLPSVFDRKPANESCVTINERETKSTTRYLDLLVMNAIKEDIPGPGSYKPLKSSFDMSAVPSNRYIRPTFSIKRPDVHPAPNVYNVNYKLVEPSIPTWPMKKSIVNTSSSKIIISTASPASYFVQNDDISHKICLQMKTDQRLMVSKQPFNSSTERKL